MFKVTDIIANTEGGEQVYDVVMPSDGLAAFLAALPSDVSSVVVTLVREEDEVLSAPDPDDFNRYVAGDR